MVWPNLNSIQTVIFLKNNSLEFFQKEGAKVAKLDFPPNTFQNQDIVNPESLEKSVTDFITENKIKTQKALLLMSDDLIFQKTLPITDTENDEFEINKFFGEIPFEPPSIARKVIRKKNKFILIAVNKNIFYLVKDVLENNRVEIAGVFPFSVLGVDAVTGLTPPIIKRILSDYKFYESFNFLTDSENALTIASQEKTEIKKNPFPAILAVFIGAFLFSFLFLFYILNRNHLLFLPSSLYSFLPFAPKPETTSFPSPSAFLFTPTIVSSPSATVKPLAKIETRIIVNNGTGTSGQALYVKNLLLKLGYQKIELSNSGTSTTNTTVNFNPAVADNFKIEILDELKKSFTAVDLQSSPSADFDINIVTGTQK